MIAREALDSLRAEYPEGTRIELVQMDIQAPPTGTKGTVSGVDDLGSYGALGQRFQSECRIWSRYR